MKTQLEKTRFQTAFEQTSNSVLTPLLIVIVSTFFFWQQSQDSVFFVFLTLIVVCMLLLQILSTSYLKKAQEMKDAQEVQENSKAIKPYLFRYAFLNGLCATIWTSQTLYIYYTANQTYLTEALIVLMLVVMTVVVKSAGSVRIFLSFALPALAPVGVIMALSEDATFMIFALLILTFFAITTKLVQYAKNIMQDSKEIYKENQRLTQTLESERLKIEQYKKKFSTDVQVYETQTSVLRQEKEKAENLAQKLYSLASRDGLTGAYNRRYFDNHLAKVWRVNRLRQQSLAVILCDLDQFKGYNDYYGHQMGDECLREVVSTLQNVATRPEDIVTRYGGEEFAIILPETSLEGAAYVAYKMQEAIRNLNIEHQNSSVSAFVTMSFGVSAVIPDFDIDAETLVRQADLALYQAKAEGRNKVCLYSSGSSVDIALAAKAESRKLRLS